MKFEEARLKYKIKTQGKCATCQHRDVTASRINPYCLVRQSYMYKSDLIDRFAIKFCKYYEPK